MSVSLSEVIIVLEGKPIAWKRPAQMRSNSSRYDSQSADKHAHSILAFRQVTSLCESEKVKMQSGKPIFSEQEALKVSYLFLFEKGKTDQAFAPVKCDLDNLVKYYNDMLQTFFMKGVLWEDDKQIAEIHARKAWTASNPRTVINVERISAERRIWP